MRKVMFSLGLLFLFLTIVPVSAQEDDPGEAEDHYERALSYEDSGDYEQAIADFNVAIELDQPSQTATSIAALPITIVVTSLRPLRITHRRSNSIRNLPSPTTTSTSTTQHDLTGIWRRA